LAAQYTAGFLASAVVFLVYWDALVWYEHDRGAYRTTPDTAAIFATYPSPQLQGERQGQCPTTAMAAS